MGAHLQLLSGFVQQKHGAVLQLKEVADDGEDAVQHLIQVKRRKDRLTGVIQNSDLLHRFEQSESVSIVKTWTTRLPAGRNC